MARHVPVKGRKGIYTSDTKKGLLYEVRYRDSDGRDRFKSCGYRLKDALDFQASIRTKLSAGHRYAPSKRRFAETAEEWRAWKLGEGHKLSENTVRIYEIILDGILLPHFGKRVLQQISVDDVALFLRELNHSPSYCQNILLVLNSVLKYAASPRRGYLAVNPCDHLDRDERPKRGKLDVRILNPEEAGRLLGVAGYPLRGMLILALTQGLRIGEILGLQWQDVAFDTDTLHIRRQRTVTRKIAPPKGGNPRDIPLFPPARAELFQMSSRFQNGFVFTTGNGTPFDHQRIDALFRKARTEAGLAETPRAFRFHDCRHTFASALLQDGRDVIWVSGLLGHANANITIDTYTHVVHREDRMVEATERLAGVLGQWALAQ